MGRTSVHGPSWRGSWWVRMQPTNLVVPVWNNAGSATSDTSMAIVPSSDAAFYRVVGH